MRKILIFAVALSTAGCLADISAIKRNDLTAVQSQLDKGKSADLLLYIAAEEGRPDVIRFLVEKGANVDGAGGQWGTPLHRAVVLSTDDTVEVLLELGADPFFKRPADNKTPLEVALRRGHAKMAQMLKDAMAEGPEARKARLALETERKAAIAVLKEKLPAIEAEEKAGDEARLAGKSEEALRYYVSALKECPPGTDKDQELKEKVIRFALTLIPPPAIPQEATDHSDRAQAFVRRSQDTEGYHSAIAEFQKSLQAAPWWADAYYNLGLIQDKAGDYSGAAQNLKLYLTAAPEAKDAEKVKKKILELEVAQEIEQKGTKQ